MIIILCYVERNNIRYNSTRLDLLFFFIPFPLHSSFSRKRLCELSTRSISPSIYREEKFKLNLIAYFFNETKRKEKKKKKRFIRRILDVKYSRYSAVIGCSSSFCVENRRFLRVREVGISADLIRGRSSNFYGVWREGGGRRARGDGSHGNVT